METQDQAKAPAARGGAGTPGTRASEPLSIGDLPTVQPGPATGLGRVDRYELVEKLGQGGFGAVYRARDTVAAIEVAIKALPPLVAHNPEELERVRANFALVSKLSHPHIAAVHHLHQVGQVDAAAEAALRLSRGDFLVVMEFVPGSTLSAWRHLFPGCQVPVPVAIELCRQLAGALDYAHSQKVLHRDVKPSNVMVCGAPARPSDSPASLPGEAAVPVPAPTVKLLDFGLAAEIRSSLSRVSREVGDRAGTFPYMAPEQWLGKAQGAAADQYALAVVFHELVGGGVPFASAFETSDARIMMNVVQTQTSEPLAALSKKQNQALQRALAKDPAGRFASCADLVAALSGAKVAGPPAGPAKRRRLALAAAIGLAGLLAVLAALGHLFRASGRAGGSNQSNPSDHTDRTRPADRPPPGAVARVEPPAPAPPAPPAAPTVSLAQVAPVKSEAELKLERLKALDQGHDFSSRIEPVAQELGQARTFFEAKDYGTALDRYQKVISASAELQSEIAAAQERLPQPVTMVCVAGGSEVSGATVTVDGATQAEKTPLTLKLSRGQAHRVEVRLDSRGGKRYLPGTAAYTVAQTGPQTLRVDLREFTGPAEGESWVVPGLGIGFEWIRPGTFQMGSTQAERDWAGGPEGQGGKPELFADEGQSPRQAAVRKGFWLGRTEVTVGQWRRFVTATGYQTDAEKAGEAWCFDTNQDPAKWGMVKGKNWRDPNFPVDLKDEHPVVCISWNDAVAFCQWLTTKERQAERLLPGLEYRLPSEAEWEYACRGGREGTKFWWGDAVEDGKGRLNAAGDGALGGKLGNATWSAKFPWSDGYAWVATVDSFGSRGRNGFGLADMLGNVWEWCYDGYDQAGAHAEVWTGDSARRVLRGGSFGHVPGDVRCANRDWYAPTVAVAFFGFRVCCGVGFSAP